MTDEALVTKLQVRPGSRLLLLAAPDGYRERVDPLPGGGSIDETPVTGALYDAIHLFSRDSAALASLAPAALATYRPGAVLVGATPRAARRRGRT